MQVETSTTKIELRLLGGFGLEIDGVAVDITPSAQRLLAFIALTPRGAERCYTAFQLWPEHDERRAKANLRSALWRLGKASPDLIDATKSHLRLSGAVWVDIRHGIGELAATPDDSIAACTLPFQALDSDLLPDWYDDWLTVERERLRQFRLGSLEEGAALALERGRPAQSIQLALAAIAADPLRESAHRLVAAAHIENGNLADAHRQYESFEAMVEAELGCQPSARFRSMIDDATHQPLPRPILIAV
jgi:DNA-binding SARP family transcriptional activator